MFTCGAVSIWLLVVTCRYSGIPIFRYTVSLHSAWLSFEISSSRGLDVSSPTSLLFCALRCPAELVFCARDFYEREYFVSCVRIVFGQRLCRAAYTSPVKLSALFRRVTADICVVFVIIRRKICLCQYFFVILQRLSEKKTYCIVIKRLHVCPC